MKSVINFDKVITEGNVSYAADIANNMLNEYFASHALPEFCMDRQLYAGMTYEEIRGVVAEWSSYAREMRALIVQVANIYQSITHLGIIEHPFVGAYLDMLTLSAGIHLCATTLADYEVEASNYGAVLDIPM